jgi:hypothetical protein
MFSYSNPAFIDAETRHRRERLAQDWSPRRGAALDAVVTGRARLAFHPAAALRSPFRRHRHA